MLNCFWELLKQKWEHFKCYDRGSLKETKLMCLEVNQEVVMVP